MPNPTVAQGNAYLETTAGNTRFNSMQIELRRRMSTGLLVQGSYAYQFGRKTWTQRSLREDWFYVPSTGGPDHAFKVNWVYELPFGPGKKFGSGVSAVVDGFIGGWEIDGVARVQSGTKFNYGGYRLVGMTEEEFAGHVQVLSRDRSDREGRERRPMDRIYMLPQDVIQQSIIALYTDVGDDGDRLRRRRRADRPVPGAGQRSGLRAVQRGAGQCPGTAGTTRIVTGPMYWKVDLSFVKRIPMRKNVRVEARMDLFNVFDTINFNWRPPPSGASHHQLAGDVGGDRHQRVAGSGRPDHVSSVCA